MQWYHIRHFPANDFSNIKLFATQIYFFSIVLQVFYEYTSHLAIVFPGTLCNNSKYVHLLYLFIENKKKTQIHKTSQSWKFATFSRIFGVCFDDNNE